LHKDQKNQSDYHTRGLLFLTRYVSFKNNQ
jgi:hypothetical protein